MPYPDAADLRRARTATSPCVRRDALEHAAAGADAPERAGLVEAARAFALRIVDEGGTTDADRLTYAFRLALSRPPTDAEKNILIQLMEKQKARVCRGLDQHACALDRQGRTAEAARWRDARDARRLDGRRARAAEPGRNDHEGVAEARTHRWPTAKTSTSRSSARSSATSHAAGSSRSAASASAPSRCIRCSAASWRGTAHAASADPLAPKAPHFAPKAKRVIFLFMAGAPSHLELFDNKPELAKFDGKLPPAELLKGYRAAFINPNSKLLGPKFKFAKHGQCGAELSELLPHLAKVVDDIAIVKSMADRRVQPRAGADLHEHRLAAVRPAEHRRVDDLRPGQRIAGPARLRRLQHRHKGHQRRHVELGQRLPADGLPGRAVPQRRAIRCCTSRTRRGVDADDAARLARRDQRS